MIRSSGNVQEEASLLVIHDEAQPSAIESIDRIIKKSIKKQASDLHFESLNDTLRVRYRSDGILHEMCQFPKKQAETLITRLKVMANLDISEHRLPQDGRFYFGQREKKIDCRVSTCPTSQGEKVVIRLLNTEQTLLSLENLGMEATQKALFYHAIHQPQGLILVTGPTGSGKTMTLYSALHEIHHPEKNILTIEDPIEIELSGINQTAIHPKIGLTFAKTLRAFLRQDPDIMMVGEIRDEETANITLRAAQTGHLVFSTLHTNSASASISRLIHLGVSPYDIASSLTLVISQRLVRKLCDFCKQPAQHTHLQGYQAVGCEYCNQGYHGRIGIFEILPISAEWKDKTALEMDPAAFIQHYVAKTRFLLLKESGLIKVRNGITSMEELKRVVL